MRMLICMLFLLIIARKDGRCQGSVNFNNGGIVFATTADRNVYIGAVGTQNGGTLVVGTKFKVQLYVGPDANQLVSIVRHFQVFELPPARAPGVADPGY